MFAGDGAGDAVCSAVTAKVSTTWSLLSAVIVPPYESFTFARSDAHATSTMGLGDAKLVAPAQVALRVMPTPSPAGVTPRMTGTRNASLRIAPPLASYGVMPSGTGVAATPARNTW